MPSATAARPRASILLGRNDEKSAEKILGSCFALLLVISAVLTGVLLLANRSLLLAFGASANTIGYSLSYLNIYTLGTVFVQLTLGMNAFITAQGFARTSMLSVLIGAVSNIILDPLFIFTLHMGVAGAAWATILSQCISCIWVLQFLCSRSSYLRIRRENVRLDGSILRPCVKLGTGTFIMQISESIVTICFNSSLLKYGGDIAVGAMTILHSVMQFALLPLQGLGQGAQPILSYNYGAANGDPRRADLPLLMKHQPHLLSLLLGAHHAVPARCSAASSRPTPRSSRSRCARCASTRPRSGCSARRSPAR
jgi:putative MATE family efflux protein